MAKYNRLIVSNAMLFANLLAVWGSSLISYYLTEQTSYYDQQIMELGWEYSQVLEWVYFLIVGVLMIFYELPIRRALKMKQANTKIDSDHLLKARQRLLNEPYIIATLDFVLWFIIGLGFMVFLIYAGVEPSMVFIEGLDMLLTALITVTIAFFILQFILQKWLVPIFFPEGQLSAVPGTQKTQIKKTLLNLSFALNFIPLAIIIFTHLEYTYKLQGTINQDTTLSSLNSQIIILSLIFLGVGVLLTLIVSRNLSRPLTEITRVLAGVGNGNFDDKVLVTTNDEIGYTGDVINKMTEGLKERERLQQSINIAQEVQQLLLPQVNPVVTGLDIAGKSIYCEETGGDYYDFLQLASEESAKTGVIVGDVSGHGIGSALFMSSARALLRLRSNQSDTLSKIVNDVNRELSDDFGDSGQFMTLFYLVIEHSTRNANWVRAGHDPAIMYNPQNDTFDELHGSGLPIGVDADWRYEEEKRQNLPKDQIILIGTDGIWEAQNTEGKMFGKEPIYEIIRQNAADSSNQILKCIVDELNRFQKGHNPTDDVTLVVIKT